VPPQRRIAMKKVNKNKVQQVFITHLLKEGHVELVLPNDMILEVGITQENKYGDLEKNPEYCWVIASQNGRSVSIDEYNLGLRFQDEKDRMICEHDGIAQNGDQIKILDVI
jgi:hypothetical protein